MPIKNYKLRQLKPNVKEVVKEVPNIKKDLQKK